MKGMGMRIGEGNMGCPEIRGRFEFRAFERVNGERDGVTGDSSGLLTPSRSRGSLSRLYPFNRIRKIINSSYEV